MSNKIAIVRKVYSEREVLTMIETLHVCGATIVGISGIPGDIPVYSVSTIGAPPAVHIWALVESIQVETQIDRNYVAALSAKTPYQTKERAKPVPDKV